jgi:hypothetical protein
MSLVHNGASNGAEDFCLKSLQDFYVGLGSWTPELNSITPDRFQYNQEQYDCVFTSTLLSRPYYYSIFFFFGGIKLKLKVRDLIQVTFCSFSKLPSRYLFLLWRKSLGLLQKWCKIEFKWIFVCSTFSPFKDYHINNDAVPILFHISIYISAQRVKMKRRKRKKNWN